MKKTLTTVFALITTFNPLIAEPYFYDHHTPLGGPETFVIKQCLLDLKQLAIEIEQNVEFIHYIMENHDKPDFWDSEEVKAKINKPSERTWLK